MTTNTSKPETNDEILYKLGSIESTVNHLSSSVTAAISRLEEKFETTDRYRTEKMDELAKRIVKNEERIDNIQDWKDSIVIKLGFAASAISLFWVVFTEPIQHFFNGIF